MSIHLTWTLILCFSTTFGPKLKIKNILVVAIKSIKINETMLSCMW